MCVHVCVFGFVSASSAVLMDKQHGQEVAVLQWRSVGRVWWMYERSGNWSFWQEGVEAPLSLLTPSQVGYGETKVIFYKSY